MRFLPAAAALLVVWGGVSPAAAQGKKGPKTPSPRVSRPQQNPAKELDRFQRMSPEERQKELDKLPPARRQQIEQRLERLQNLSPKQRQQALDRLQKLHDLPPERQHAVRQELQQLRALPPGERKERLNQDSEKFSPDELKLLRESSGQREML